MFDHVSKSITDKLTLRGLAVQEDAALYQYGVRQLLTVLLNLATTIVIGCMFGMLLESLLILAAFIPLRSFAGGYHARTALRCYVMSVLITAAALFVLKLLPESFWLYGAVYGIFSACILIFAPVEDENKPLDALEQKIYRRRTVFVWIAESAAGVVLILLHQQQIWRCLAVSITMLGVLVLAGQIKNTVRQQRIEKNKRTTK